MLFTKRTYTQAHNHTKYYNMMQYAFISRRHLTGNSYALYSKVQQNTILYSTIHYTTIQYTTVVTITSVSNIFHLDKYTAVTVSFLMIWISVTYSNSSIKSISAHRIYNNI